MPDDVARMTGLAPSADISVVIPIGERRSDLAELYGGYRQELERTGHRYEVIFVVDGPNAAAVGELRTLRTGSEQRLTVVQLARSFGEATALMSGFAQATGDIILTLPAYYQIEPAEIHRLLEGVAGADMTIARRWPRAGDAYEHWRRVVFHRMVSAVTGLRFTDLGCNARAIKRRVIGELSLYGDQQRFLPVLVERQGFQVVEIEVRQSPRDRFDGRYGLRQYAHRALDVLTLLFLVRFTKKPLRFFGMIGVLTLGLGALLLLYLAAERLIFGIPLADRPALMLASLLAVVGIQLFAVGLLGELVIFTHAGQLKDYQVDEVIQFPVGSDTPPASQERRQANAG